VTLLTKVAYWLLLAFPAVLLSVKPLAIVIFAVLSILGIVMIIQAHTNPFSESSLKAFSWLTWGYFFVMVISVIFSNEPSNDWRHLSRIVYFFLAPLVGVVILKSEVALPTWIASFKVGTIIAGLTVWIQYLFLDETGRLSGMYNPNTFGDIAVIMLYISLLQILRESKAALWLSYGALFFGVSAVAQSGSRGSLLALLLMLPIFAWVMRRRDILKKRRLWGVVAAITVTLFFNLSVSYTLGQRMMNIGSEVQKSTSSAGQRIEMYRAGWKAFLDAPILGYGYHNCGSAAARYTDQNEIVQKEFDGRWHLHNIFITDMVNAGILGLIALLALYLVPLRLFFRTIGLNSSASAGILTITGYLLIGLTHTQFGYEYETAFYVLVVGYFMQHARKTKDV